MARVALAFAYDGTLFDSFARQPGRRTVEGELLRVLAASGVVRDAASAGFEVASRTDAGVSAAWNVCALDTSVDARRVAHLRHDVPGLWLLSASGAPADFSPRRHATMKRYVYAVAEDAGIDWGAAKEAASLFVGLHDFRNFCRPDRGVPTRRTLTRIEAGPEGIVFEAPSFLWEQVRRVTRAVLGVARGEVDLSRVRRRLERPDVVDKQAAAPAEGLVLEDVQVPVRFAPASRSLARRFEEEARRQRLRARFYERLSARAPTARR